MASVRSIAGCLGVDMGGDVSLLDRLFGFERGRVPTDPNKSVTAEVSLLELIRDVRHDHIHLNVIRVGFDLLADEDQGREKLDWAILRIREIYRQVNLGVGRVEHYYITSAEADGMGDLGSESEARELWQSSSIYNDGIDAFVVRNISDDWAGGAPPGGGGSCEKDSKRDGLIGGYSGQDFDEFARTFAHEVGHFLGLTHNHLENECPTTTSGKNRLMAQNPCAISMRDSVNLTGTEGSTMRDHCSVRGGC
jgi:hypothetical protein